MPISRVQARWLDTLDPKYIDVPIVRSGGEAKPEPCRD